MITPDEIEQLLKAATGGEWEAQGDSVGAGSHWIATSPAVNFGAEGEATIQLMAHARELAGVYLRVADLLKTYREFGDPDCAGSAIYRAYGYVATDLATALSGDDL